MNDSNYIIWGDGSENTNQIPKKIWLYWDGYSDLVNICIKNIEHYLPNFEINILNNQSLKSFLPNIPEAKKDIPLANYVDLVRLELLSKYGGIWMDASILLTENLDWLFSLKNKYNTDLIGFYSDSCTTDLEYPILENWFLASDVNNVFINDWLEEYRKCYSSDNPKSYYNNIKENKEYIQNVLPLADYLLPYLSAIKIMRENQDYKILMFSANKTGHYFNTGHYLNYFNFLNLFLKKPSPKSYPMLIKFEKRGRNFLDEKLRIGKFKKESFLIEISQKETFKEKITRFVNYLKFLISNYYKKK